ncbi:MAG: ankyrin repeat domain-containing protein [Verrucomicrobia bacterium]|nr:ankyrin repeat domain-containing protein [Verrucomicrobiota bacterium]
MTMGARQFCRIATWRLVVGMGWLFFTGSISCAAENQADALVVAAESGDVNRVKLLLEQGVDVNAVSRRVGATALMLAAGRGQIEVVRLLLDKGADLEAGKGKHGTALIWAAPVTGVGNDVLKLFMEKGADVNAKREDGTTALIAAAEHGNMESLKFLLDQGGDVRMKNSDGKTALEMALEEEKFKIATQIRRSANIALLAAAKQGDPVEVRDLAEHGAEVNAKGENGWTPLLWAVQGGHHDAIRFLLYKGADAEAADKKGVTSLKLAANQNDRVTIELLNDAIRVLQMRRKQENPSRQEQVTVKLQAEDIGYNGKTAKLQMSLRCNAQDLKVGDEIPIEYAIKNLGVEEFVHYLDNRTEAGVRTLRFLLDDPDPNIRADVRDAIKGAYRHRGVTKGRPLKPEDFPEIAGSK